MSCGPHIPAGEASSHNRSKNEIIKLTQKVRILYIYSAHASDGVRRMGEKGTNRCSSHDLSKANMK